MPDVDQPRDMRWSEPSTFSTGHASLNLFARRTSEKERERWAKEDGKRDKKRGPLGFGKQ